MPGKEQLYSRILRYKARGEWIEPPIGLIHELEHGWSTWLDALSSGRTATLIEQWQRSKEQLTSEEIRERGEKARRDLYGNP